MKNILEKFGMAKCRPVNNPLDLNVKLKRPKGNEDVISSNLPYQQLVRYIMYLAVCT